MPPPPTFRRRATPLYVEVVVWATMMGEGDGGHLGYFCYDFDSDSYEKKETCTSITVHVRILRPFR